MKFLKYLFFKYYYFQVKVGDGDIAPYSALLCICVIIEAIYADILGFYCFFVSHGKHYSVPGIRYVIALFVLSFVLLYFLLVHKQKYKRLLKENEARWKGKKNLGAILFAVLPFVIFFVATYIKLRMNQGKI